MNKSSANQERNNPLQMVNDLVEVMRICDAEPQEFIERCLSIKTKNQQTVLLHLNTAQSMIYNRIKKLRALGKPIRMIILKARQEGVSTLCEALIFERTARFENTNSLIVAHEPESTDAIFAMSKLFYDLLPTWAKPMRRYDNKKQMVFENPEEKTRSADPGLRSRMVIATADKGSLLEKCQRPDALGTASNPEPTKHDRVSGINGQWLRR
jgi:hypothetical protein